MDSADQRRSERALATSSLGGLGTFGAPHDPGVRTRDQDYSPPTTVLVLGRYGINWKLCDEGVHAIRDVPWFVFDAWGVLRSGTRRVPNNFVSHKA